MRDRGLGEGMQTERDRKVEHEEWDRVGVCD